MNEAARQRLAVHLLGVDAGPGIVLGAVLRSPPAAPPAVPPALPPALPPAVPDESRGLHADVRPARTNATAGTMAKKRMWAPVKG
jgi:hypothetical protein